MAKASMFYSLWGSGLTFTKGCLKCLEIIARRHHSLNWIQMFRVCVQSPGLVMLPMDSDKCVCKHKRMDVKSRSHP